MNASSETHKVRLGALLGHESGGRVDRQSADGAVIGVQLQLETSAAIRNKLQGAGLARLQRCGQVIAMQMHFVRSVTVDDQAYLVALADPQGIRSDDSVAGQPYFQLHGSSWRRDGCGLGRQHDPGPGQGRRGDGQKQCDTQDGLQRNDG